MDVPNAVDRSRRKRTDEFPLDLAAQSAMLSLIRTVKGTWKEQRSDRSYYGREWETSN